MISQPVSSIFPSALWVHDSQAYRKMDVIRERLSHTLELRELLLSFQTGFNLVSPAVVCTIMESISSPEPSSDITQPRYLKLVTVTGFCPFKLCAKVKQLTNNVHLATSAQSICYFGFMGSHNRLCTFHTFTNLLVTNLFYIHPWHQMTEVAK